MTTDLENKLLKRAAFYRFFFENMVILLLGIFNILLYRQFSHFFKHTVLNSSVKDLPAIEYLII